MLLDIINVAMSYKAHTKMHFYNLVPKYFLYI